MKILREYISKNNSGEWFINTIDVGINLESIIKSYSAKELQDEIKEFVETCGPKIQTQLTVEEIESDIMDYYLK